jgi:hypothetical protein
MPSSEAAIFQGYAMNQERIRRQIRERISVPLSTAGKALGLGRRATRAAVDAGEIPVNRGGGKETVPTDWLRPKVLLDDQA